MPGTLATLPRRGSTSSQPGTSPPDDAPATPPSSKPGLSSTAVGTGDSSPARNRRSRAILVPTPSCTGPS